MLKELIISALVIPFLPRQRAGKDFSSTPHLVIDAIPVPPLVPAPMSPVFTGDSVAAVRAFLGEMMDFTPGDPVRISIVQLSYNKLAELNGWPPLSTKALSMHLVAMGCRRLKLDLRQRGEGRPTAIEFPLEIKAYKKRRARKQ